jgi:hypothetical protein
MGMTRCPGREDGFHDVGLYAVAISLGGVMRCATLYPSVFGVVSL